MIELDKIYNEDCLTGMQRIPDGIVDAIICDLPYGVLNKNNKNAQWDNVIPFEPLWEQYLRVAKENAAIVLFSQGMFTAKLMMSRADIWRYNIIWDKILISGFLNAKRMPLRCHEDICVFYRKLPTYNPQYTEGKPSHSKGTKIFEKEVTNNNYGSYEPTECDLDSSSKCPTSIVRFQKPHPSVSVHPTQKSCELLQWIIRTYSNEGELILDSCVGSGTTAIAAIREKRHFIGFELNKEYFDKANERIRMELSEPELF